MKVNIISSDQLWLDSLTVSLGFLLERDIETYTHISKSLVRAIELSDSESILLVDSNIPGLDYWALLEWLSERYQGKAIILKDNWSYNLCAERMLRQGCFAVVDKSLGFVAFWLAISAAIEGHQYKIEKDMSFFSKLSASEQALANDLLSSSVGSVSKSRGVSQQAINKKKLTIYRKLNIPTVSPDKPFKLMAQLFC